jgi:hypothetical protein
LRSLRPGVPARASGLAWADVAHGDTISACPRKSLNRFSDKDMRDHSAYITRSVDGCLSG